MALVCGEDVKVKYVSNSPLGRDSKLSGPTTLYIMLNGKELLSGIFGIHQTSQNGNSWFPVPKAPVDAVGGPA